jgi:hypothetical protein
VGAVGRPIAPGSDDASRPSPADPPTPDTGQRVPGGFEFAWPPPELAGRELQAYVFDGHRLLPLPIEAGPGAVGMSRASRAE